MALNENSGTHDFEKEILSAKLELRNYFSLKLVRRIYDDIAQILSLARMEIAFISEKQNDDSSRKLQETSDMVAKCIQELRYSCKLLFPETQLTNPETFRYCIDLAILSGNPNCNCEIEIDHCFELMEESETQILLFSCIVAIAGQLNEKEIKISLFRFACENTLIKMLLQVPNVTLTDAGNWLQNLNSFVNDRIRSLNGNSTIADAGSSTQIIIEIPQKNKYEQFKISNS